MAQQNNQANLIWSIAEILRGSWKQYEYQDVTLPLVLLKRLDTILEPTKPEVLEAYNRFSGEVDVEPILKSIAGAEFYNTSPYDFTSLLEEPSHIGQNFRTYMAGYSENIRDIIEKFDFDKHLQRLEGGNLLYHIIKELNKVDLHPDAVDNHQMGSIFETLLRKFSEQSNETAGEHYTPREVIELMVELLFDPDADELKKQHVIRRVYDCASGTGGMLSVAKDYVEAHVNPSAELYLYGQELNPQTYAISKSDMLIKGENPDFIKGGEKDHSKASTLSNDQFLGEQFDYLLTNPPFGVDWKKDKEAVEKEATRGYAGRFGAGMPRISDGQLLFLQHMVSKMKPAHEGGSRLAIVMNGSPLFSGSAGSGESEIRRWILEKDLLETIIALPDQLFYNTGISTYIWILSNRKSAARAGKVQLIDARKFFAKMRKSLGNKRHEITEPNRSKIVELYKAFTESEHVKIFDTTHFGYRQITIERPMQRNFAATPERIARLDQIESLVKKPERLELLKSIAQHVNPNKIYANLAEFEGLIKLRSQDLGRTSPAERKLLWQALSETDENAPLITDAKGNPELDPELRDTENVPLTENLSEYFSREVQTYMPTAILNDKIVDHRSGEVGRVGYDIPFTRFFYTYLPPRRLAEVVSDIEQTETELAELLEEIKK